jgi:hypothetical protein
MSRAPAVWMLVVGLVLTRLLGVHIHTCAGLEGTTHPHEAPHFADSGLIFGESHDADHADDREVDLALATLTAKVQLLSDEPGIVAAADLSLSGSVGWLTARTVRGPPVVVATRPDFLSPPLRGPPALSLT